MLASSLVSGYRQRKNMMFFGEFEHPYTNIHPMTADSERWRFAVVVPSRDRADLLATCLEALLPQLGINAAVAIVVDDASQLPLIDAPATAALLAQPNVRVVRRSQAGGPGAARNEGLRLAKQLGVEVAVLLDSDCVPPPDYVQTHLTHHREMPDAACVGGAVVGVGAGFWSRVDAAMSWFTSMPGMPASDVRYPVHIPTLNLSLKLAAVDPFVEGLRYAGEDAYFVLELVRKGRRIVFAGSPVLQHFDRVCFAAVFRHQFRWGYHTYSIRLGFDPSLAKRILFALGILAASPAYAILASYYILSAWLPRRPSDWTIAPVVFALSAAKAVAASCGALFPFFAFYPGYSPLDRTKTRQ
jgi:GT2 family glycosyltransferase